MQLSLTPADSLHTAASLIENSCSFDYNYEVHYRLGMTEWSDPSEKLPRHFGPPLGRGARTAPTRRNVGVAQGCGETFASFWIIPHLSLSTFQRSIFGTTSSSMFHLCSLLGLRGIPSRPHPSEGVG